MPSWIDFKNKTDYSDLADGKKYIVEWRGIFMVQPIYFRNTVTWSKIDECFHYENGNAVDGVQYYQELPAPLLSG